MSPDEPEPKSPGGEPFPPEARLRLPGDIRDVLARAWRTTTGHLVVYVTLNRGSIPRLGVTVSRKVGGAVQRNRIRRRLREGFRRRIRKSLEHEPADVLVRVLPGAADCSQEMLETEVLAAIDHWQRKGSPGGRPRRAASKKP